MCGIVGITSYKDVVEGLIYGLLRLEYRGYDSAGIATLTDGKIELCRAKGKVADLVDKLKGCKVKGNIGIAHTRWATHGEPSEVNAHPQTSDIVSVVHNGIIENYAELKRQAAAKGYVFKSQTDTEVITALITLNRKEGMSPKQAVLNALHMLKGAFAIEVLFADEPDMLIGARSGAPLAIGYGDKEMFIGSDAIALSPFTDKLSYLEDGDVVIVTPNGAEICDNEGNPVTRAVVTSSAKDAAIGKGDYRHFMIKEIFEQPEAVADTVEYFFDNVKPDGMLKNIPFDLSQTKRIFIVACGTSYHAGLVAKYWLEEYAKVPIDIDYASEFRYRNPVLDKDTLAILISQSGETADTLAALRYFKENKVKTLAIVNVAESTMAREADFTVKTLAGPEIAVASTKAFTTQLALFACITITMARLTGALPSEKIASLTKELYILPDKMKEFLKGSAYLEDIAKDMIVKADNALYVGRGDSYPIALEGALKIKEISYIHAEGYAAGEMKHGPIALVDNGLPIVVIAPYDKYFEKTLSNMQEIMARGGRIICISSERGVKEVQDYVPVTITMPDIDHFLSPILYSLPVQLLAYNTALLKGMEVDQPRNLAKSVTVE